jgi:hypothetical protein
MTIIRHCVEESNVDENFFVLDPTQVKHAIIIGGKIQSMSGIIDTKSHLNLDYPDHKVSTCVIAEKFNVGSRIKIVDEGLVFARVDPADYKHYGQVDYTQRLSDMIEAVKGLRVEKEKSITSSKSI